MFSKVKAGMRRIGARTQEELEKGLGMVLRQVTAEDARGWFKHSFFPPIILKHAVTRTQVI